MKPKLLLETKDFLVINKPSGLVVHADGKHEEPTVVDWINENYPELKDIGEKMVIEHQGNTIEIPRSGIVHRIDRDTSGCLLIAKNQESFEDLKRQFQEHTIKKKYIAIVFGWPRDERGIIDQSIGRSSSNIRAWTTKPGARGGREAITRFTVRKKFEYQGEKYSIVDLYPQTGRTHQLRVHMGHIGHSLVADAIYSPSKKSLLPITRTALHAERVSFHDLAGKLVEVEAPVPEDLKPFV
jgi:23S rRNA pseudouridine1911/1915/1917 synthase